MEVEVLCQLEGKTIAHMDVEVPEPGAITAAMINEAWEPVADEYQWEGLAEPGDQACCPHCGGVLFFIEV
jgi:hypothetical protein